MFSPQQYRYYKKQEYQDLYNSSIAFTLMEMVREVITDSHFKTGFTFISKPVRLHHTADDFDCCFMVILSCRQRVGPRILEKIWESYCKWSFCSFAREELKACLERWPHGVIQTERALKIP